MTVTTMEASARVRAGSGPLPERATLNPTALSRDGRIQYQVHDGERTRVLGVTVTGTVRALTTLTELGPLPISTLICELAARLGGADAARHAIRSGFGCGLLVAATDDAGPKSLLPEPPAGVERRLITRPPAGYEQAFTDLAHVARFSALFDRAHDTRALLTVVFTDRFGVAGRANLVDASADLLSTAGRRARMLSDATSEDFGPADGSLTELPRLRATAWKALSEWCARPAPVELDPARLAALADGLPTRFATTPVEYRALAEPRDGSLAIHAFDAVASEGHRTLAEPGDGSSAVRALDAVAAGGEQRSLAGAGDGLSAGLAFEAVVGAAVDPRRGPRTAEQWCRVELVHRPETDVLVLVDGDGVEFTVPGAAGRVPGGLPAPLQAAAWISGAGFMVDPFAAVNARSGGQVTAGRVVLGSGARAESGGPAWLISCDGGAA